MAKKKTPILKKVSLFIITTLVVIFLLEILLRSTYSLYSNYNTEMWRYSSELKQKSSYPGLGHEHVPNKTSFLYGVEIKTNSLGLRANKEYKIPKPRGIKRILILGDSITMGWGVEYNNTYPKVLETLLNKNTNQTYEVINTGVGNYNAINELATLKKLLKLEPDMVILGFYINDIEEIYYCSEIVCWLERNSYLYAFVYDKIIKLKYRGETNYKNYYLNLYKDEKLRNNLKRTLNQMIQIANNNSIYFIFVNIPEFHEFKNYPFEEVDQFIEREIINNSTITYINLLPKFKNETLENIWVSYEDPHPNAKGHRIIANSIFQKIINLV
ncbi:MAG: SGNH/GDSL hydrolase family protein [DPANN group archaeon]|nr:SGNH/GDSL hydrolase family protein [DPANN group archaeon]